MELLLEVKEEKKIKNLCKTIIIFESYEDLKEKLNAFIELNLTTIRGVKNADINFYIDYKKFKGGINSSSKNLIKDEFLKQITHYLSKSVFDYMEDPKHGIIPQNN